MDTYVPSKGSPRERFAILAVGFLGNKVMVDGFDKVLYPAVIWWLGPILGGGIMMFLSLIICLLTFMFYDWAKKDWLGIETIKEARDATENKFLRWAMRQSDPVLFIALSVWTDPFITTVVMRHGAWKFNGLSPRDWKIFLWSWVIGNLEWILMLTGGIWIIREKIWPWLQPMVMPIIQNINFFQ